MVQPKFVFLDPLSALSVQVQYKKVSNDEFCKNCLSKYKKEVMLNPT